ncbi:MAG: M48 family metallopeptidase [SAR324 cluster bacterium]|nr:M48 family metallopeptidase [SAR324 cluster bacterium]
MRLNGHFMDGETSRRQPVEVMPAAGALLIYGADRVLVGTWSYQGLKLVDEALAGQPVRFRHDEMGEALLAVDSHEILEHIERSGDVGFRKASAIRPTRAMLLFSVSLLMGLIFLIWWGVPRLAAPLVRLIPFAWEKELGESVVHSLREGRAFCANREGAAALAEMAGKLIAAAGPQYTAAGQQDTAAGPQNTAAGAQRPTTVPLTVRVIPEKTVNAFAAPGGQVVLFSGLIEKAESPEEVAGVMAHEIAHAIERHPMQSMLRAAGVFLLVGLLVGDTSTLGTFASEGAKVLLVLSYSRDTEREADRIGMELLNKAGIRGDGLLDFFARLQGERGEEGRLPVLFASHPMHAERVERLKLLATGTQAALSQKQWQALRDICR